jgi:hypothetical protein
MTLTHKSVLVGIVLVAAAVAAARFTSLSRAEGPAHADDCPMFSCIFDDTADDD